MFTKSCTLTALVFLTLAQATAQDAATKDLERLQGSWTMHALEINGKSVSKIQETNLIVKKDEYKTTVKKKEQPGLKFKLDPSKNPKWIDMTQPQPDGTEKVLKGIYKIENDTFVICRGTVPEHERPNQFATWPDTGYFVVTWKKQVK